jgi:hypothetical protein
MYALNSIKTTFYSAGTYFESTALIKSLHFLDKGRSEKLKAARSVHENAYQLCDEIHGETVRMGPSADWVCHAANQGVGARFVMPDLAGVEWCVCSPKVGVVVCPTDWQRGFSKKLLVAVATPHNS